MSGVWRLVRASNRAGMLYQLRGFNTGCTWGLRACGDPVELQQPVGILAGASVVCWPCGGFAAVPRREDWLASCCSTQKSQPLHRACRHCSRITLRHTMPSRTSCSSRVTARVMALELRAATWVPLATADPCLTLGRLGGTREVL